VFRPGYITESLSHVIATARLVYVGDMNSSVEGRRTEGALKMEVATEHRAVQAVVGCRCCVGRWISVDGDV
jgi:hypothetical protein